MISVDIISKIVGRGTGKTPAMVGGESNINLSDYLLKEIWEKVFEIKTDEAGNEYIFGKLPVVTKYGITMYGQDSADVPNIFDGLPIDRQTLIWKDGVLMVNPELDLGNGGGIDENELRDYLTRNDYAKKSDITTALSGYATTSSLNAVSTKLDDFLEGSDTDTIINKWKELEAFLSGLSESDNLATILSTKWTTDNNLINQWNTAYGWGDHSKVGYALKSYVDGTFVTIKGNEDVTGLHNFVNGLMIGGIELIQKNGNAFLKGNLVVEGGITMYGDGEGGSSAPAYSSLGALLNVDDSIDATASVDRVLFQSAGSSMWVSKPLSEIGGGGGSVSGAVRYLSTLGSTGSWYDSTYRLYGEWGLHDRLYLKTEGGYDVVANLAEKDGNGNVIASTYLPLSGGTIRGSGDYSAEPLIIKNDNSNYSGLTIFANTTARVHLGYWKNLGGVRVENVASRCGLSILDDGIPSYYTMDSSGTFTKNTIWHSGNDGSGSGLDADTLDGKHLSDILSSNVASATRATYSRYIGSLGRDGTTWYDDRYPIYFQWGGAGGNILYIKCGDYPIVSTAAIKLQTARTIWGQSFDGTGNITAPPKVYKDTSSYVSFYSANGSVYYGDIGFANGEPAIWTQALGWRSILHARNYSSYALPLSGGTLTGPLILNGSVENGSNRYASQILFNNNGSTVAALSISTNAFIINPKSNSTLNQWILRTDGSKSQIPTPVLINGNITLYNGTNISPYIYFQRSNEGDGYTDFKIHAESGSLYFTKISSTTAVVFQFKETGDLLATGGITMYSDIRKKTKLQDVELSLSQIANAPLIQHYYNSDDAKTTHVGSIAQYWAGLNDWFCKLDNEGYYTMEIQNAALASAISIARHLEKYESKTDKKIRQLKKRISQLEDELELLKKGA